MPITDQFWQYAREAMLSACDAKTDDETQALLQLAADLDLSGTSRAAICQSPQPDCGPPGVSCSRRRFRAAESALAPTIFKNITEGITI